MCRNIKTLFNFEPPATDREVRDAALQFVRKLSGFNSPSKANQAAFDRTEILYAGDLFGITMRRVKTTCVKTHGQENRPIHRPFLEEIATQRHAVDAR